MVRHLVPPMRPEENQAAEVGVLGSRLQRAAIGQSGRSWRVNE